MGKCALITGVEGQDGYYLLRHLLQNGYRVFGLVRKKAQHDLLQSGLSDVNYQRIYADMMEFSSLYACIEETQPDEIYNLAGLSEIPISWKQPVITAEVNAVGVLRLLEAARLLNPDIRFLQSSTSEIFALSDEPLCESSPLATRNPYGTAKLYGQWITTNYRESYGMYACSAILFNHESPRRGIEFVTRKITSTAARICLGLDQVLELGNLDAVRDWGSAEDYVEAMWLMLQQDQPGDYVIASGVPHTVRDFTTIAFRVLGMELEWEGADFNEVARDRKTGRVVVRVNPAFYRFPKADRIVGDPTKARQMLKFQPKHSFEQLVEEIVMSDYNALKRGRA